MARENQGLQISLIFFVITTILFGVMTFLFYSSYTKADKRAEDNKKTATQADNGLREMTKDMEELKGVAGFAATDDISRIRDMFNKDMDKYAGTYPKDKRNYRDTLVRMFDDIRTKNQLIDDKLVKLKELTDNYAAERATKDAQLKKFDETTKTAQKDKQDEIDKFNDDRERMKKEKENLATKVKDLGQQLDTEKTTLQGAIDTQEKLVTELKNKLESATGKLADVINTDPKSFDGKIRWVNQANKTVWVDLGRADSLPSQATFSVYSADAGATTENTVKASIEITEILGSHLAEGRIVADKDTDPILPGDRIDSPVWSPGEKRHFAIVGAIDMDNDGRGEDLDRLHTLIEMNGGVVDAKKDAKGKRQGSIDINTRYLVLGEESADASPEMREDWKKMQDRATELGTEQISLQKLLDLMGWKKDTEVLRYGSGAKGFDVHSDRPPRVSTGKISELFQKRTPPKPKKDSAF